MTGQTPPRTAPHILLIEDSEVDAALLEAHLLAEGLTPAITRVETAEAMRAALADAPAQWDAVIADYHLPRFSAPAALDVLRESGLDLPFIIVSGAVGEEAAVAAMKAGAHDYVMKDRLARLVPVIERELREAEARRERRRAEQARDRLAAVLEATSDSVSITDASGRSLYLNAAARALFGIPADEDVAGRTMLESFPAWAREKLLAEAVPTATAHQSWSGELAVLDRNGAEVPISQVLVAGREANAPNGDVEYFAAIGRDISERRRWEADLQRLALYDQLTGLANRTLFRDRLVQTIATGRARAGFALLQLDVDRFKETNDALGDAGGDAVLRALADRLRLALDGVDTLARLGGDEFAAILPHADRERAILAAQRVAHALKAPIAVAGQSVELDVSAGIALFPEHGQDPETLLRRCAAAMSAAKRGGGGYAVYSAELDPQVGGQRLAAGDLRHAIERDHLALAYQPKIDARTGAAPGVEALVRWSHPHHGSVPPSRFVPLAEQTGLIRPLTRWVLTKAVKQCLAWHEEGLGLHVAVNVSMLDLHDPELPELVETLLHRYPVPPGSLCLEITETAVMEDPRRTWDVLARLRALGIRLAVDDFGTGHGSLLYVKRLPVHQLKVDQSFVRDMVAHEADRIIVRSTIELAHNLGLKVVAEGIEDAQTWALLAELGCDEGQGYLFGRPMSADQLRTWLSHRAAGQPGRALGAPSLN